MRDSRLVKQNVVNIKRDRETNNGSIVGDQVNSSLLSLAAAAGEVGLSKYGKVVFLFKLFVRTKETIIMITTHCAVSFILLFL